MSRPCRIAKVRPRDGTERTRATWPSQDVRAQPATSFIAAWSIEVPSCSHSVFLRPRSRWCACAATASFTWPRDASATTSLRSHCSPIDG
jgi:hypothetical protein